MVRLLFDENAVAFSKGAGLPSANKKPVDDEHGMLSLVQHASGEPTYCCPRPAKERGPHQLRHRCRSRLVGGALRVGLALDAGKTLARRAVGLKGGGCDGPRRQEIGSRKACPPAA